MQSQYAREEVVASAANGRWLALAAALLGWTFDGFEMGLFPLIGSPALRDLLGPAAATDVAKWFGAIMAVFLVGAATGGVLFGWLGDRVGRVRSMAASILTYSVFTGLCAFATEPWHMAALRFVASLGMGGQWSLGVALVNEIWPGKSRALIAGLIGAAANVGTLGAGLISLGLLRFIGAAESMLLAIGLSRDTTMLMLANSGWRLLMISGALPALLVLLIRSFVPESDRWQDERAKGATAHWANRDLIGVLVGCVATLTIIWAWSPIGTGGLLASIVTVAGIAVALLGFLSPVRGYLSRAEASGAGPDVREQRTIVRHMLLGAALAGIAQLGTWGAIQWAPLWASQLEPDPSRLAREYTQISLSLGAIAGTILVALAADRFGRRVTYTAMCLGSILSATFLYNANSEFDAKFLASIFAAGGVTASFYGWLPLYLPELFPTFVRATAQGFAFNFGRILAAVGGLQTATLMAFFNGSFPRAGSALASIYLLGAIVVWLGPETSRQQLPD